MGLFSALRSIGGAVATTVRSAGAIPGVKFIPGVGTALTLGSAALSVGSMFGGGGGGGGSLPPSPFGGAGPLNGPGGGIVDPRAGQRGWLSNDPNVPENLKGQMLSKQYLRQYYRAPKGYVVMPDAAGDPMGVPKHIAKMYGWKPAKKPLLSIRDTNAIRHAGSVINKLKKFNKTVQKIANFQASPRRGAPRNIIIERPGTKVIGRKVA